MPRMYGEKARTTISRCRASMAILLAAAMVLGGMVAVDTAHALTFPVTNAADLNTVNNGLANNGHGGLKEPSRGTIGGENSTSTDDHGVATWVGGNMYVGAPKEGVDSYGTDSYINETYAVEAEGLTLVNGKLAMNLVKGKWRQVQPADNITFDRSWHRNGFRFGVVGFGGQVRPAKYATVLSVGNNIADNSLTLTDRSGNNVSVLGFDETGRGFVDAKEQYWIDVNGSQSTAIGSYDFYNHTTDSLYVFDPTYGDNGFVTGNNPGYKTNWNYQDSIKKENIFAQVNYREGGTENGELKSRDFSHFQNTVEDMSAQISGLSNTGTTSIDVAPSTTTPYVRQKYNYYQKQDYTLGMGGDGNLSKYPAGTNEYSLELTFNEQYKEKLITFHGDGMSTTQVFTLDAAQLSCAGGYNGVSFSFENIPNFGTAEDPKYAAVIVNIEGQVPDDFHVGWRFWWNTEDVSNGYVMPPSGNVDGVNHDALTLLNTKYSRVSESIMWNFKDATNLKILGGKVLTGQAVWQAPKWSIGWHKNWADGGQEGIYYYYDGTHKYGAGQSDTMQVYVDDDPAAAMLGSIMVPKGTLESHVTTNGRVWVGGDFMMYNPTGLERYAVPTWNAAESKHGDGSWNFEDISASLVCMDQERHNFIWSADYTESASTITWSKTNESGDLIGGTTWGVYASLDNARNKTNALVSITDNGITDMDPTVGVFRTQGLVRNANYYIREIAAPGYEVNSRIYQINTNDGAVADQIVAVFNGDGNLIADSSDFGLTNVTDSNPRKQGIANRRLPSAEWEKVDSESKAWLSGSAWTLKKEGDTATHTITDTTSTRVYFNPTTANWTKNDYRVQYRVGDATDWVAQTVSMERCSTNTNDACSKEWYADVPSSGNGFQFRILSGDMNNPETYQALIGGQSQPFTVPESVGYFSVVSSSRTIRNAPDCAYESTLWRDGDPVAGKFHVPGLTNGTYVLTETAVPTGYQRPFNTSYTFTVANGTVTWSEGADCDSFADGVQIGNTRKPGEVTWEKIAQQSQRQPKQGQVDDPDTPAALSEEGNHQLLAGAEWSLQYTPYQQTTGTVTLTIKDCMPADNGSSDVNCTATDNSHSWAVDGNHKAGEFKISGMPWGDYVLTEAKAPDGYNLDATPHKFSIGVKTSEDGSTVVGTGGTVTDGNTTISINLGKIENEPGVMLPATGAEGRHLWPAIVGALFVLASFGCAVALRMRE
ncbi:surface-anchored fimbrial subunit [Bifidobacterium animalis subsp. animalis]|nr:surface-anchored fimbrial subunit [Bifidobacterium animalis subsp. animalis]